MSSRQDSKWQMRYDDMEHMEKMMEIQHKVSNCVGAAGVPTSKVNQLKMHVNQVRHEILNINKDPTKRPNYNGRINVNKRGQLSVVKSFN